MDALSPTTDLAAPPAKAPGTTKGAGQARQLPDWFPDWAQHLAELYFSGTTSMFLVHGNTFDCTRIGDAEAARYGTLSEFLAEQVFGRWDLVLSYDLARGLRCLAGSNDQRLKDMVALANKRIGDLSQAPRDPASVLAILDKFILRNIMALDDKDRLSVAFCMDHAAFLVPEGDVGRLGTGSSTNIVTLLNWATSPYVKRLNMAFVLINDKLASMNDRMSSNPHVAAIEVPLPTEAARLAFVEHAIAGLDLDTFSDFDAAALSELTAGISLTDINVLIQSTIEGGRRLDDETFRALKKRLIERQAQGLLEFIEPSWTLDMVIGHEAAKERLTEDAVLLKKGQVRSMPMGYLFCGPVGTGKSFLAECTTGTIGIPCVKLKNFRSKYVGETEGNLERVLSVLRAMGPVVVIIDEADTQLGDREASGDSGTSSRVFGMIAAQMGDTRYRGKIIWMLLTARPDLLPIDLKRQGRAEVHIPLFYPTNIDEVKALFMAMSKKMGAKLDKADLPDIEFTGKLSGADIEGIVGRAWRRSLLAGTDRIEAAILQEAVESFMPSTNTLEKEMQEVAAMIECTDRQFLPQDIINRIEALGGRDRLQERLTALRQLVESR